MGLDNFLWVGGAVVVLIAWYLIRNGRRNSDPLNRKAAAEICEYLMTPDPGPSDTMDIVEIFRQNARYRSQAKHVASMVPALLINAGVPREIALSSHQTVMKAVELLPE